MKPFVRRSHLIVDARDADSVAASWTHDADAVILTLPEGNARIEARSELTDSIDIAARGGAEVFIQASAAVSYADLLHVNTAHFSGVVAHGVESAAQIAKVAKALDGLEERLGLTENSLHIIVLLDSGAGVWNVREIARASKRVSSVGLDEAGLCRSLGIEQTAGFDPFEYAKGRVIIEARASRVQPIGLTHPLGVPGYADGLDDAEIARLALRSKNLGFAGAICPSAAWASHCNRAFSPPEDRLEFYRETRRLFAEGIARGTAAVPYPGTTMMIDVPVDENARVNLELWERCAARDAEKAATVARSKGF